MKLRLLLTIFVFALGSMYVGAQTVVKVVGGRSKLVILSDGTLLGCGQNDYHEISPANGPINALLAIKLPGKAVDAATGERTSYAVLDDGSVWAWGQGIDGELGNGGRVNSTVPVRVAGVSNAISVIADSYTALALTREGSVYAWGRRNGAIGDGTSPQSYGVDWPGPAISPVRVPKVSNIKQISIGYGAVLALTNDGRVLSWGANNYGALGRAPRQELPLDTAAEVPGLTNVVMVAAGPGVSTALKRDGTVWVWGSNYQGQFGNGERDGTVGMNVGWYLEPRQVAGVANVAAISVGMAGRHTLALLKDGTLRGWGNTDWGQLGTGVSGTFQLTPVVPRISGVKAIFAAGNNSFAVKNDGTLWAWGIGGRTLWPFPANTKLPVQISLK
ncbi:MAG: hypothetical protein QM785_03190 [Pyrinomonadaceae bacterium]